MTHYRIGQVSEWLGISSVALRHYEKIDLVIPSYRSSAGYRLYTDNDINVLKFVLNAKDAGLSLSEIKQLIELDPEDIKGSKVVKDIVTMKIASLEKTMVNMKFILSFLHELNSLCDGKVSTKNCPILLELNRWE
jgi:DNA-binding transcriptional MerR regulator